MTGPTPLPIDISELLVPLPDPAHDLIREKVVAAVQAVWTNHLGLLAALNVAQGQLATALQMISAQASAITALTARVAALEPTPSTEERRGD